LWQWGRDALLEGGVDDVVLVGDLPGGVEGGARRRDSVAAGLAEVADDARYVLVHDAARPLASAALVRRVIERLVAGGVDGVIPVVPVGDTIKEVADGIVVATIPRAALHAAQTPQGFVAAALREAHRAHDDDATDDAALVEAAGGKVAVVAGETAALKVTYPLDLAVAAMLLEGEEAGT
jgi:2-C-methyl-D-erythritol 4-phosphate cytidylyltransferase